MRMRTFNKVTRTLTLCGLLASIFLSIPAPKAEAANDVQGACVIGSSSSCPAQSPQEIANLYGTSANGTYWLNVNGTATQTFLILDSTYPDSGMWFLGMKGTKTSTNFNYSSTYWTSQSTTLNTNSLSNDVATDAKFNAFNYLPATKVLAVFKDRNSYNFSASGTGMYNPNSFGGHVWKEDISSQTMFSRFTNNSILYSQTGTMTRYDLYRESNSSSANLVFSYQNGYAKYGFNYNNAAATYRWGIAFNNENDDPRIDSSDAQVGIGLTGYGAASVYSYSDSMGFAINGSTGLNNGATATHPSGFQIWGKMAAPSMAAPASLSRTNLGNGAVTLNIGAASGATEYAVQYKLSTDTWANSTTVRVLNPTASPTAALTGLASGTYDFRVWTRGTNNSSASAISILAQAVDATAPTISSASYLTTSGSDNVYGLGDTVTVRLTFNETVTVTGSPRIPVQGLSSKFATYGSGSGTRFLDFNYVVSAGDEDRDGISFTGNSFDLNGGTIEDLSLNDAVLTFSTLSPAPFAAVDGITPSVTSVTTSTNGSTLIISSSETPSSVALTASWFAVSVNGVNNVVTNAMQSGAKVNLTLTFGIVAGDVVSLTYTDPTAANNLYAFQDIAGNDYASFTVGVTNASTATSNTSISLALNPASATAVYRANTSIVATVSAAGKVDFRAQGKNIPGCKSVSTSGSAPITATCTWKPSNQRTVSITATFRPSGSGLMNATSSPLPVLVTKRTGTR